MGALADVGRYLDSGQAFPLILEGDVGGNWGPIIVSLSLWILLPLLVGAWRVATRDVRA